MRIHTLRRMVPAAFAAGALLLGATACGGGDKVDKSALVSKLKSDSSFTPALDDSKAGCVADVLTKYVDHGDINNYIKTGKEIPEPKKDKDKAGTELQNCVK